MFNPGTCVRLNASGKEALRKKPQMLGAKDTREDDIGLVLGQTATMYWTEVMFLRTGEVLYLRVGELEAVAPPRVSEHA